MGSKEKCFDRERDTFLMSYCASPLLLKKTFLNVLLLEGEGLSRIVNAFFLKKVRIFILLKKGIGDFFF